MRFVLFKMLRFDGKKQWSNAHEELAADFHSLLYINTVSISSVFIRKSLLDKFGGLSESHKVDHQKIMSFF